MLHSAARRPLLGLIEEGLTRDGDTEANLLAVLDRVLHDFGCAVGTLHRLDPESGLLHMRAQRGLPDILLARVQTIPVGKGMAGLAAQRRQPVRVCNLQNHDGSLARPAASATGMEGSIAVPILVGGALVGVLGVAKSVPYDFSDTETATLLDVGSLIGRFWRQAE